MDTIPAQQNKIGRYGSDLHLRMNRKPAVSAFSSLRCRPATLALSTLSFVAYLARILLYRLTEIAPEGGLLDKSLLAHCLFHPVSPPSCSDCFYVLQPGYSFSLCISYQARVVCQPGKWEEKTSPFLNAAYDMNIVDFFSSSLRVCNWLWCFVSSSRSADRM